jgi:glycerol-3-phosphate cytidylyltransferase-like family protein
MHTYFNKANYVFLTIHQVGQEVIVHSFDPNTQDTGRWISKAKASLVYRASSRTAKKQTLSQKRKQYETKMIKRRI